MAEGDRAYLDDSARGHALGRRGHVLLGETMTREDVLIVGAGPTGLVLALWLNEMGVKVRLVDKAPGPGTSSRALAVQARTLELYRQLDLADAVLARGNRATRVSFWVSGSCKGTMELGSLGESITPYPYVHVFPQDQHEQLLTERLERRGVVVERNTELVDFDDRGEYVSARLRGPEEKEGACEARYIVGCDGARSAVRRLIDAEFPGGTYPQVFYVADIEGGGAAINGQVHIDLDDADVLVVLGYGEGRARLVGVVSGGGDAHVEGLGFEDVAHRAIRNMKLNIERVRWFSTYRVHHRVAGRFRRGRAFLAGDAGHIHSPAGGQGMNTGIGDAINLAWKLAAALHGEAEDGLLDSYEAERISFARKLVKTTDRLFTLATTEGRVADVMRKRMAPVILPMAARMSVAQDFLFRTVSQTMLNYRHGPLAEGEAGHVRGGDRLPWAPAKGGDNFDACRAIRWQVHVYGAPKSDLAAWCAAHSLSLCTFEWAPEHESAGFARDAAYLVRPDTYVALADPSGSPRVLERFLTTRGLRLSGATAVDRSS